VRAIDAVGGAVLSGAAVLLVAWALGVAIAGSGLGGITPLVRNSSVLAHVDRVLPQSASTLLNAFNNVVGTSFFPRYLEPFAPERIVKVGPGPERLLTDPDVEAAAPSVLKIRGTNECGRGIEGTGFVYSADRLMTNAHVVAGVDDPDVIMGDNTVPAQVVYYNAELDVAVLDVETADTPALAFDRSAEAEDGVAILGYPQDGPYDVQTARIRAEQRLRSPNIYGEGTVIREVFSLRGLVRPGNSGGPIVSSGGDVVGVVFAASVTDRDTGYALTADQVARSAAIGVSNTEEVSTGDCAG
jgi:S1-C subfamily serine protease